VSSRAAWLAGAVALAVAVVAVLGIARTATAATLFSDNFEDGNSSGWSTSGGTWSVGTDGSRVYRQTGTSTTARARAGSATWTSYTVTARVKPTAFNGSNRYGALLARAQSSSSYYHLALRNNNTVELARVVSGGITALATAPLTVTVGSWYALSLSVSGSTLRGTVNGSTVVSATDSQFASGQIGVVTFNTAVNVDDVSVDTGPGPDPSSPGPSSPGPSSPVPQPPPGQPDGFAAVNALGQNGTTGGAGGPTVPITTSAQLEDYAGRPGPYILMISGTISFDDMITVVANKTIIGVGTSATITGGGLQLGSTTRPGNNVIIRNIRFTNASDDSISVTNSAHHVWIDHNDFSNGFDGLVDIKRMSDFVTVSWNHFHNHSKSTLVGHSDTFTGDIGHLRVTYHHNFFDNTVQRHPRVRFGDPVHVYNNFYLNNELYGVASTENAGVLVEGNYFRNVAFPIYVGYDESGPGRVVERNNIYEGSGTPQTAGTVVEPRTYYGYTVDNPASVPSVVPAGAGVGRI
jgi:pectate lyase